MSLRRVLEVARALRSLSPEERSLAIRESGVRRRKRRRAKRAKASKSKPKPKLNAKTKPRREVVRVPISKAPVSQKAASVATA